MAENNEELESVNNLEVADQEEVVESTTATDTTDNNVGNVEEIEESETNDSDDTNQKEEIKEQLYTIIESDIQAFVEKGGRLIQSSYQVQWDKEVEQEKTTLVHEADVLYQQFIDRLFVEVDMADLVKTKQQMDVILAGYREEGNEA